MSYTDDSLTFLMHVYGDVPEAAHSLRSVRAHYPDARVIVIADGDRDPRIPALAELHRATYVPGERLYVGHGKIGRYSERMLRSFLEEPTDVLVKIDPDTRVLRRFNDLPKTLLYGGTVEHRTDDKKREPIDPPNVQGGCMVCARSLAQSIIAQNVLLRPVWERKPEKTWCRFSGAVSAYYKRQKLMDDLFLSYVVQQLGVPLTDWDEVWSRWMTRPDAEARRRAIVHKWDWTAEPSFSG